MPDDRRRRNLTAVLGFLELLPQAPELRLLHEWADTWGGVGAIVAGLHRSGYDLHLTQYGARRGRAPFYVTGVAHWILGGSAWEPTVWRAIQLAGWNALKHAEHNSR